MRFTVYFMISVRCGVGKHGTCFLLQSHKITTKLQNNQHSESPKIELNERLTTRELKKKPHETGRKGRDVEQTGPTPKSGR